MNENKSKDRGPSASILKQKIKFPVDEDFTGSCMENTLSVRTNKRVSFKRVSFIKPFISDVDDKNTIWDNTYEEEVNHTDSAQETLLQKGEESVAVDLNTTKLFPDEETDDKSIVDVKDLNCTFANKHDTLLLNESMQLTQPVGRNRSNYAEASNISMNMTCLPMLDKENSIDKTVGLRNKVSILTFAKRSEICFSNTIPNASNSVAASETYGNKLYMERFSVATEKFNVNNDVVQMPPTDVDLNEVPMEVSFNAQVQDCSADMEISYCDPSPLSNENIDCNVNKNSVSEIEKTNSLLVRSEIRNPLATINPSATFVTSSQSELNTNNTSLRKSGPLNSFPEAVLTSNISINSVPQIFHESMELTCRLPHVDISSEKSGDKENMNMRHAFEVDCIEKENINIQIDTLVNKAPSSNISVFILDERSKKSTEFENPVRSQNHLPSEMLKVRNVHQNSEVSDTSVNIVDAKIINESMQLTCKYSTIESCNTVASVKEHKCSDMHLTCNKLGQLINTTPLEKSKEKQNASSNVKNTSPVITVNINCENVNCNVSKKTSCSPSASEVEQTSTVLERNEIRNPLATINPTARSVTSSSLGLNTNNTSLCKGGSLSSSPEAMCTSNISTLDSRKFTETKCIETQQPPFQTFKKPNHSTLGSITKNQKSSEEKMDFTCNISRQNPIVEPDLQIFHESKQLTQRDGLNLSNITSEKNNFEQATGGDKEIINIRHAFQACGIDKDNRNNQIDKLVNNGPSSNISGFILDECTKKSTELENRLRSQNPVQSEVLKLRNVHLNSQISDTIVNTVDTKINESMQLHYKYSTLESCNTVQSLKEHMYSDMHLKCHIPGQLINTTPLEKSNEKQNASSNVKDPSSVTTAKINCDPQILDESMQFTCKFTPLKSFNSFNTIPQARKINILEVKKQTSSNSNSEIPVCQSDCQEQSHVQLTHQVPGISESIILSTLIQDLKEDMETCLHGPASKLNILPDVHFVNDSMQLTCKFSQLNSLKTKSETVHAHNDKTSNLDKENINPNGNPLDRITNFSNIQESKNQKYRETKSLETFGKLAENELPMSSEPSQQPEEMELTCSVPTYDPSDAQILNESMQEIINISNNEDAIERNLKRQRSKCGSESMKLLPQILVNSLPIKNAQLIGSMSKFEEVGVISDPLQGSTKNTGCNHQNPTYVSNKHKNMFSTETVVLNETVQGDMEFTCQIPVPTTNSVREPNNGDVHINESMEFTCKFPVAQISKIENKQPQLHMIHDDITKCDQNLNNQYHNSIDKENDNPGTNTSTSVSILHHKSTNVDNKILGFENVQKHASLKRPYESFKTNAVEALNYSLVSKLPRLERSIEESISKNEVTQVLQNSENDKDVNMEMNNTSQVLAFKSLSQGVDRNHQSMSNFNRERQNVRGDVFCNADLHFPMFLEKHSHIDILKRHPICYSRDDIEITQTDPSVKTLMEQPTILNSSPGMNDNSDCSINFMKDTNMSLSSCIDNTQKLINFPLSKQSKDLSFGLQNSTLASCQITEHNESLIIIHDNNSANAINLVECTNRNNSSKVWQKNIADQTSLLISNPILSFSKEIPKNTSDVDQHSVRIQNTDEGVLQSPQYTDKALEYIDRREQEVSKLLTKSGSHFVQTSGDILERSHCSYTQNVDLENTEDVISNAKTSFRMDDTLFEEVQNSVDTYLAQESSSLLDELDLVEADEHSHTSNHCPKVFLNDVKKVINDLQFTEYHFAEFDYTYNIYKMLSSKSIKCLNEKFDQIKIQPIKIPQLKQIYDKCDESNETPVSIDGDIPSESPQEVDKPITIQAYGSGRVNLNPCLQAVEVLSKPVSLLDKIEESQKRRKNSEVSQHLCDFCCLQHYVHDKLFSLDIPVF